MLTILKNFISNEYFISIAIQQAVTNACSELFFSEKDPNDETLCNFIYNNLAKAHPEEVLKIENNTAGGWKKFWSEVIQSLVSRFIHNKYIMFY